jgi:FkbM family methyltransferase
MEASLLTGLLHRLNMSLNRWGMGNWPQVVWAKKTVKPYLTWARMATQPGLLNEGVAWLRQIDYVGHRQDDGPLCLDVGDKALIAYPDTLRSYYYEDRFALQLFTQMLSPGQRVLDVGAHNGLYSIVAARHVGPTGQVYAFEPEPNNVEMLERNILVNGFASIVNVVPKCVGDKNTIVRLSVIDECSRSHSRYQHPLLHVRDVVEVESIVLDDFLNGQTASIVKLDIEGDEPYALAGLQKTIASSENLTVFAELHPTMLVGRGTSVESYIEMFSQLGFHLQAIDEEARALRPIHLADILERAKSQWWHTNLLATKGRVPAGLAARRSD